MTVGRNANAHNLFIRGFSEPKTDFGLGNDKNVVFIRYDERGIGSSDWHVDNATYEDWFAILNALWLIWGWNGPSIFSVFLGVLALPSIVPFAILQQFRNWSFMVDSLSVGGSPRMNRRLCNPSRRACSSKPAGAKKAQRFGDRSHPVSFRLLRRNNQTGSTSCSTNVGSSGP